MRSDLHHDSNSELTWISKINQTNSMIILKNIFFCKLLACESCSYVPTEIESRFGFSSKIGMFSSNSGRFDTLLWFFSGGPRGGVLPRIKIENRGLPNCWKTIEIVNPSTTDLFLLFVFF